MSLHNRNIDWEKDAPHIAAAGRENPFVVPEGYFSTMHQQLNSRIAIEEIGKDPGFYAPEGYFDELPELVEAKIAVEALKEELSTEGFKVPEGYFETLGQKITERTVSKKRNRILSMVPKWTPYAAAACITAIIGITFFFSTTQNSIDHRISKLPDHEIESYLNLYTDQTDMRVIEENIETKDAFSVVTNNISEKELEEYIEETL